MTLVLASGSPRRQQILTEIGQLQRDFEFEIVTPDIDETYQGEAAADFVLRLAKEKAQAGFALCHHLEAPRVIGSDTIVVLDGNILGKPVDKADAVKTLQALSGQTHQVMTAVAITNGSETVSKVVSTAVTFCQLNMEDILAYIETQEPMDKAGAYGIQAIGGSFVASINGSYSAVVGLPMVETRQLLQAMSVI